MDKKLDPSASRPVIDNPNFNLLSPLMIRTILGGGVGPIDPKTFRKYKATPGFPKPFSLYGKNLYSAIEFHQWLKDLREGKIKPALSRSKGRYCNDGNPEQY